MKNQAQVVLLELHLVENKITSQKIFTFTYDPGQKGGSQPHRASSPKIQDFTFIS